MVMLRNMLCLLIGYRLSGNVIGEQNVDTRVVGYFYLIICGPKVQQ